MYGFLHPVRLNPVVCSTTWHSRAVSEPRSLTLWDAPFVTLRWTLCLSEAFGHFAFRYSLLPHAGTDLVRLSFDPWWCVPIAYLIPVPGPGHGGLRGLRGGKVDGRMLAPFGVGI